MATNRKYYEFRSCASCGDFREVRKDSKATMCNPCAKLGNNNPNYGNVKFVGSLKDYKYYHYKVNAERGKASKCINGCDATRYHWANISGKYEDTSDYQEMCPTCHSEFDRK